MSSSWFFLREIGETRTSPVPPPLGDQVRRSKTSIATSGRRPFFRAAPSGGRPIFGLRRSSCFGVACAGRPPCLSDVTKDLKSAAGPAPTSRTSRTPAASLASLIRSFNHIESTIDGLSGFPFNVPITGTSNSLARTSPPTSVGRIISSSPAIPVPRMSPRIVPSIRSGSQPDAFACVGAVAALMIDGCARNTSLDSKLARSASSATRCWDKQTALADEGVAPRTRCRRAVGDLSCQDGDLGV